MLEPMFINFGGQSAFAAAGVVKCLRVATSVRYCNEDGTDCVLLVDRQLYSPRAGRHRVCRTGRRE